MDDHRYFFLRAEREIEMARQASCEEAQRVHEALAARYLARLYEEAPRVDRGKPPTDARTEWSWVAEREGAAGTRPVMKTIAARTDGGL